MASLTLSKGSNLSLTKADPGLTQAMVGLGWDPRTTSGEQFDLDASAIAFDAQGNKLAIVWFMHLKDFRERFKINGEMVPKEAVAAFVEDHRSAFEPIEASFFEWGVALAFQWFREQQVDIAVIETGLGGRLDSTNVVMPEVSIITNIAWDHADLLGDTLEKIAWEKAGIIKHNVPVVIGEATGSIAEVFREKAKEMNAPIHFTDQQAPLPYTLDLAGPHQERNARAVVAAVGILQERGWSITEEHIARGLANVRKNTGFAGRWQTIGEDPLTIVDVGHNEDGLRIVKEMLARTPHEDLHIVLGTVSDKDLTRMLAQLPKNAIYYFCKANIPRGLEAEKLAHLAENAGLHGTVHKNVASALAAARSNAGQKDLVLVSGSIFTVAEVL